MFFPFSFPGVYKRLEFKLDMVPFPISKNTLRGYKAISLRAKSNDEVIFVEGLFTGTFSKDWIFSPSNGKGKYPKLLQINKDLQKLVGSFKLQPIFKISVELDHSKNPSNHHLVTNI